MPKLTLVPYLTLWLLLTVVQVGALLWMTPVAGPASMRLAPELGVTAILVLQTLRIPPTMGRLRDLGRPSEHALLVLVPLVSIGLARSLLRRSPTEADRRMGTTLPQLETSATGAFVKGFQALFGAPVVVGATMALAAAWFCMVEAVALPWFRGVVAQTQPAFRVSGAGSGVGDTHVIVFQGLLVVSGVLGLWTVLQIFNRKKASRASWLPSLILPPVLLCTVGSWPFISQNFDKSAAPGFFGAGLILAWLIFGGGLLNTLFVALGHDLRSHGRVQMSRAMAWWRPRWVGGLAVHGAMISLVYLGVQALFVPGAIYAILTAFVVPIAMLHPEAPAFRRSRKLSRGSWATVFLLLAIGGVLATVVEFGAVALYDQIDLLMTGTSAFMDDDGNHHLGTVAAGWVTSRAMPAAVPIPPIAAGLGAALSVLFPGAVSAGLVWLYGERLALSSARQQAKKVEGAPESGEE